MASLLSLPEELQLVILTHLDAPAPSALGIHDEPSAALSDSPHQPLKAVTLTSKSLRRLALPLLFRHVRVRARAHRRRQSNHDSGSLPQHNARGPKPLDCPAAGADDVQDSPSSSFAPVRSCGGTRCLEDKVQDLLDFLERYTLIREVTSFLLSTERLYACSRTGDRSFHWMQPSGPPIDTALWTRLFSAIEPSTITIVAPPVNLALLTGCEVDTSGDWAFTDMDYHVLQLTQSANTKSPRVDPRGSVSLFALRPWTRIALNEGSFLRAYGSYEFFERGPPSLISSITRGLEQAIHSPLITSSSSSRSPQPALSSLTSFTYTAIFPFGNHANFNSLFTRLDEITLQFAPDVSTGILSDKARVGKAELADCWQELKTAYTGLVQAVRFLERESDSEEGQAQWVPALPQLALKKITVRDFAIKAIRDELEEIFAPLCWPAWAQSGRGVFTRLTLDDVTPASDAMSSSIEGFGAL